MRALLIRGAPAENRDFALWHDPPSSLSQECLYPCAVRDGGPHHCRNTAMVKGAWAENVGTWLQACAVRKLLAHRLSGESAERAKMEWYEVVEGDHSLWQGVSEPYKHTIRAFLVYFHSQIQRHSTERFNFRNGSVGERSCSANMILE